MDYIEELEKLSDLKNKGVISEPEFEEQKNRILHNLQNNNNNLGNSSKSEIEASKEKAFSIPPLDRPRFRDVFFHTRSSVQKILNYNGKLIPIFLYFSVGTIFLFVFMSETKANDYDFASTFFKALAFGIPFSYISSDIITFFVHILAKLNGGKGTYKDTRKIFIWMCIPFLLCVPTLLIIFLLFPSEFASNRYFVFSSIRAMGHLASIVLFSIGISEIYKISTLRSFFSTTVIPLLFLIVICIAAVTILGQKATVDIAKNNLKIDTPNIIPLEHIESDHYSISIPNKEWHFISKDTAIKTLGKEFSDADIYISKNDLSLTGVVYIQNLTDVSPHENKKEFLQRVANSYRDQFKGNKLVGETNFNNGFNISASNYNNGQKIEYIKSFRTHNFYAVTTLIWGQVSKPDLVIANNAIQDSFKELPGAGNFSKVSATEIFQKYSDAVVLIRIYDKNGKIISIGSGFNIDPKGIIITNTHVILSGGEYVDVRFPNHGTFDDVKIIAISDSKKDISILSLLAKELPFVEVLSNSNLPKVGEKVFAIGNPKGLLNTISDGIISGIRGNAETSFFQITAPISPGNSGGPIFNEFGKVIGIASLYLEGAQNLNFAVSINAIDKVETLGEGITLKDAVEYLQKAPIKK